jgi:hypothetical protein
VSHPDTISSADEPRWPAAIAGLVFALTTLTLMWPLLGGMIVLGDDQFIAGYSFRSFGAEFFRATGSVPQWNPYLFGGLPFIAAQHGDIFYPTAWLRWIVPTDIGMSLGYAIHLLLAGWFMWLFLRSLRVRWGAAVIGGVAYQLSGIVASMVRPGHDGKMFVSALTPLLFYALLRAVRDGRPWGYGLTALTVGLSMLTPHYQMTYYLLVAAGVWTLWLVFFDPERPSGRKWPVSLAAALGAVLLGIAIAALQVVPFLEYIPFSPRAEGGPSGGWEYATAYSFPPVEVFTAVLPQFNGIHDTYWGPNFFKLHSEYLGAVVIVLAVLGWRDGQRRRLVWGLTAIAVLFLLVSFGGHTPFYRLWYEVMPMMKKVRAPGMAFFLVAFPVAVLAGLGAERLLARRVTGRAVLIGTGVVAIFALLGVLGVLQNVAYALADPQQGQRVALNEPELRAGSLRLLVVALLAMAALWAVAADRIRGWAAVAAIVVVTAGDLWSMDRRYVEPIPGADITFREDPVIAALRAAPKPYRVLDVPYPQFGGPVYPGSVLMSYEIPSVLGYHGNELRYYDELMGGKNVWQYALMPNVLDLVAARYIILRQSQPLPGWHEIAATDDAAFQGPAVLFERDTAPEYARVLSAAAKIPGDQIVPTLIDPGFPVDRLALYADTAAVTPAPLGQGVPEPSPVAASVTEWAPGTIRVSLSPAPTETSYLLVSENWYPAWQAEIDGQAAPVHRANHTFLSVAVPPGASEVLFRYESDSYRTGRLVTLLALIATALLLASGFMTRKMRLQER